MGVEYRSYLEYKMHEPSRTEMEELKREVLFLKENATSTNRKMLTMSDTLEKMTRKIEAIMNDRINKDRYVTNYNLSFRVFVVFSNMLFLVGIA